MVGEVVAVGPGVTSIKEGDRFALREPHKEYVTVSTVSSETRQLLTQPPSQLYPVPGGLSDEEAPWAGLATIVQNGVRRAEQNLGETVIIIGLGLLGQLAVQYARLLGAKHVIALDLTKQRLEMAAAHGATVTLLLDVAEAREQVLRLTDGVGADVVYDVTGAAPVFSSALTLLRRFGRLVLLGDTGDPTQQHLTGDLITKGLSVIGAHDSNPPTESTDHTYWSKSRMVNLFFTYLSRGDMRVADLVTHRYSPLEAEQAYRLLCEDRASAMGVIFDWTQL
jgi:threonine dehydrogenase-like Zn-dependent dehydrogenase